MTHGDLLRIATLLVALLGLYVMWVGLRQTRQLIRAAPRRRRWRFLPRLMLLFDGAFCACALLILSNFLMLPLRVAVNAVVVSGVTLFLLTVLVAFTLPRLKELEAQAILDSLTGLFNRRYVEMALEREIQRWRRYRAPVTCLMIDVDYFKSINDRYGHPTGDWVLREVGKVLKDGVRTTDIVGRYGGEEFIVLLTNTDARQGRALAERLRAAVSAMRLPYPPKSSPNIQSGGALKLTVSIGLCGLHYEREEFTASEVIRRADDALYQAKRNGRNCVVSYVDGQEVAQQLRAG
ncbi:MAG: GGDEF domain-containing protein [Abditibacteriales bacterium]|nr:GGDEF domain-containing protein [Abditibacteriales bacterium]MDW8367472.1 GGDEF domain-containing protein [Abditibacteriales bacterium]